MIFLLFEPIFKISESMQTYYLYRQHLVGRGERSVIDLLVDQHRQRSINLTWLLDDEPIKQTNKEVEKVVKR